MLTRWASTWPSSPKVLFRRQDRRKRWKATFSSEDTIGGRGGGYLPGRVYMAGHSTHRVTRALITWRRHERDLAWQDSMKQEKNKKGWPLQEEKKTWMELVWKRKQIFGGRESVCDQIMLCMYKNLYYIINQLIFKMSCLWLKCLSIENTDAKWLLCKIFTLKN